MFLWRHRTVAPSWFSHFIHVPTGGTLPTVSGVTINPTTVASGGTAQVTVTLSGPAPSGGATITLTSSNNSAFPVINFNIAAGQTSGSAGFGTGTVATATVVTVTAAYNGSSQQTALTVNPPALPTVSGVTINPTTIASGGTAQVTVTLTGAAPSGGATITLASRNNTAFPVIDFNIAAGQTSGSAGFGSGTVATATLVTVTAAYNGSSKQATLTVNPLPTVSGLTINPTTVASGGTAQVTVTLSGPAPSTGAYINLTSNNNSAFPVIGFNVEAGQTSGSAGFGAGTVATSTLVTVTAAYNGSSEQAQIIVNPPTKTTPTVVVTPSSSSITTTQGLTVTIAVSGGNGNPIPMGSVSLSGPGYNPGAESLSSGSATFSISALVGLPTGTDTLTASYSGDTNYNAATASTTVTVTKTIPTVVISANPTSITTAQSTVVRISVGGSLNPTGTIALTSGGVTEGSGTLAGGVVQINVNGSALAVGTDTVTASYSGDNIYTTASGSTTVTVTSPAYPVYPEQPVENFGTISLGGSSATPFSFTFDFAATEVVGSTAVVTQGARGLDFSDVGTGSCDTNGTAHVYNPGDSCTLNVTFRPRYAGPRDGAVELLNSFGNVMAAASVYGIGQGPQLVFGPPATQALGGRFGNPTGVAVDGNGNVYVSDTPMVEMPAGCASPSCEMPLGGGFNGPEGVAVDGSGNVYIADYGNNAVKEMAPGCASSSCVTTLGGGFNNPAGVAVDGSGNVYVADYGNNAVKEMAPGCASSSCVTTLGGGFNNPASVAVDGSGNVYVGDYGNNAVKEMPPGCSSSGCVTPLGDGFNGPWGVAVDGGGDVYVADNGNHAVIEMPPGCASSSCVTRLRHSVGDRFSGVTVDGSGNVYAAALGSAAVYELSLATPPNLSFASTNVGSQSSDSPQTVTLRNIGNAPLSFPVPGTGENPSVSASFTLDASTTCPEVLSSGSAGSLAAGATCALELDFIPQATGSISGSVVLTDNNLNASPSTTQSSGLSGTGATPIVPYIQVNGGAWQQASSVAVNVGATVNLGPQPATGGTWSWTGPSGFSSTSRALNGIALSSPSNVYTATYTNTDGATSTQAFTITVNSTPIVPYLQVNGGAWQQIATVTVNPGDTVTLGPQPASGGSWSWTGPSGFSSTSRVINAISLPSPTNTYTATYTNTNGATSTQAFTITVNSTPIVPYLQVNGGAWQQASSVAVNVGDTVNLGPQPQSGGTWSWTGPSGFSSTSRVINATSLPSPSNTYTATYTNTNGVNSTQAFTITINPTPIVPYVQVNGGAWQQASSVAVNAGATVNLGPQPQSGGTWSWTGPTGFSSTSRVLNGVALTSASNVYTATYTNVDGVTSTQIFTITVNPTPIVPYVQVNGGAWQQASSVAVNVGDTVNLGPQPQSGGTWSWTGPNGFTSTSRVLNSIAITSPSNVYTATYTNTDGVNSTQAFTITVNSTPIVPYLQVNGGPWQQASSVTVSSGATVNLGPQPLSGGTWSWTGPNGFSSTSRVLNAIPLTTGSNVYTATYTNADGVNSTQTFTITIN